jgi:hypothetical protein
LIDVFDELNSAEDVLQIERALQLSKRFIYLPERLALALEKLLNFVLSEWFAVLIVGAAFLAMFP